MKYSTILCYILIIILVIVIYYIVQKNLNNKEERKLNERYAYLQGISPESTQKIMVDLKDMFNKVIQYGKTIPISFGPLCPGSTMETIYLHKDGCEGPLYKRAGGCKFEIPGVGCGCYLEGEGAITRITGLDSLTVDDISNIYTNVNYKTNECNLLLDLKAHATLKIYGTGRAKACINEWIGLNDNYLIESVATISLKDVSIEGKLEKDILVLNTSTFNVGSVDVKLERTDWFKNFPGIVKEVFNKFLGSIGDLWWSGISELLPSLFNIKEVLGNAIRNTNMIINIPYVGLYLAAVYVNNVVFKKPVVTIGDWKIGQVDNKLVFETNGIQGCFNEDLTFVNCTGKVGQLGQATDLPPMIKLQNIIIFASGREERRTFFQSDKKRYLYFYYPLLGKTMALIQSENNIEWKALDYKIPEREIKLFDSGIEYKELVFGDWKLFINPDDGDLTISYKNKMISLAGAIALVKGAPLDIKDRIEWCKVGCYNEAINTPLVGRCVSKSDLNECDKDAYEEYIVSQLD